MMKEKKAAGVQLLIRAVVRDPEGKVIKDTGQGPARSFVLQFLQWIGAVFDSLGTQVTDVNGVNKYIYHPIRDNYEMNTILSLGNASLYGTVVGTGDTAADNTDYALEAQIVEGAEAGELTHGAQAIEAVAVVGSNVDLELKRSFTNNSGDTITVKEAGIYCRSKQNGTQGYHMLVRDVLGGGAEVPDKCSLTVYYTLRTTV